MLQCDCLLVLLAFCSMICSLDSIVCSDRNALLFVSCLLLLHLKHLPFVIWVMRSSLDCTLEWILLLFWLLAWYNYRFGCLPPCDCLPFFRPACLTIHSLHNRASLSIMFRVRFCYLARHLTCSFVFADQLVACRYCSLEAIPTTLFRWEKRRATASALDE